ncbi:hypothetical protein [Streptomyces sp. UNOB3_S3]|nr:hypothetical protein [Streptomyces sp. UNOB3_S3]MCC3773316.1 hypothetical protein [Streptomyces sp. UNOB3_S3]
MRDEPATAPEGDLLAGQPVPCGVRHWRDRREEGAGQRPGQDGDDGAYQ